MTNKEWLDYLAHNAPDELAAWFDAEHTESPTSETMQQIGQVIEDTVKRGVYGDTGPQDADSREKLEADVRNHFWHNDWCRSDMVFGWLDRQAAITEQEVEHDLMKAGRMAVEVERERIKKLTAERDELKELNEYHALQYELASEDADRLQAQVDRLTDERERYREKFGKCLDYADAIHALMDDEGMA